MKKIHGKNEEQHEKNRKARLMVEVRRLNLMRNKAQPSNEMCNDITNRNKHQYWFGRVSGCNSAEKILKLQYIQSKKEQSYYQDEEFSDVYTKLKATPLKQ